MSGRWNGHRESAASTAKRHVDKKFVISPMYAFPTDVTMRLPEEAAGA
jgi:hypothetical protein